MEISVIVTSHWVTIEKSIEYHEKQFENINRDR